MADRKSLYTKIKKKVQGKKNPEQENIDPNLIDKANAQKQKEAESVPRDFIAMFEDETKEEVIRQLYFLSLEYKKVKRDRELLNFRLTKQEMENEG